MRTKIILFNLFYIVFVFIAFFIFEITFGGKHIEFFSQKDSSLITTYDKELGKKSKYNLVSENDKYSTAYNRGVWYKIQDDKVIMLQYGVVPKDNTESILDFLNNLEDFDINNATIVAVDNSGNQIEADLSMTLNSLTVGEIYVSFKTHDSGGLSLIFIPDYYVTVTRYLNYSDLQEDEESTSSSSEDVDTSIDFSENFE